MEENSPKRFGPFFQWSASGCKGKIRSWLFLSSLQCFVFYAFRHVRCTAERPGDHCWHWRCGLCGRRWLGPLSIAQTSRGVSVETQHGQWVPRGATNLIRGRWFPFVCRVDNIGFVGVNLDCDIHVGEMSEISPCVCFENQFIYYDIYTISRFTFYRDYLYPLYTCASNHSVNLAYGNPPWLGHRQISGMILQLSTQCLKLNHERERYFMIV